MMPSHEAVSWALLAGLLLLRFPLVVGVRLALNPPPSWLDPVYVAGTYALTCALIWWERDTLAVFHLDGLSLAMVMAFAPLSTLLRATGGAGDMPLALPHGPALLICACAILLLISLRRRRVATQRSLWRLLGWFAIGTLVGVAYALISHGVAARFFPPGEIVSRPGLMGQSLAALGLFPFQVGYASVSEEPLFRGFLWGRLRNLGWGDLAICIFQGLLFALGHLDYLLRDPLSFWFSVSMTGFIMGLLVWRSRTLVTSMAAHAASNSVFNAFGIR